jgi:spore coat protein JB
MKLSEERLALLKEIMKLQFAVIETALYLDTHPNDPRVLAKHNEYAYNLCMFKKQYEDKYEPLTHYGTSRFPWSYINGPWPWEIEY